MGSKCSKSVVLFPMKLSISLVVLAFSSCSALAIVSERGQCGGIDYTGDTSKLSATRFNATI